MPSDGRKPTEKKRGKCGNVKWAAATLTFSLRILRSGSKLGLFHASVISAVSECTGFNGGSSLCLCCLLLALFTFHLFCPVRDCACLHDVSTSTFQRSCFFCPPPSRPLRASWTAALISLPASYSLFRSTVLFFLQERLCGVAADGVFSLLEGPNADPPHEGSKTLQNLSQRHCFIRIWHENRCILTVHQCLI